MNTSTRDRSYVIPVNIATKIALGALLVTTVAWTGCTCPLNHETLIEDDTLDFRELAKAMWTVDDPNIAKEIEVEPAKAIHLAIVEFTVEFVPNPENPDIDFGTGLKLDLPAILDDAFVDSLPEFNRFAVDLDKVVSSKAYAKLEGEATGEGAQMKSDAPAETRYPASGLLALDDSQTDRVAILRELSQEVGASATLQVRLRVGVRDGRASLEKGSSFLAVGAEGSVRLDSKLTLVSPLEAVEKDGEFVAIDSSRYVRAIQRLFRPYIAMALVASGSGQ